MAEGIPSDMNESILSIQGWFDFAAIYESIVEAAPPGSTLIEIGVWKGASLCNLGLMAKQAKKDLKVVGIDRFVHDEWDGYMAIHNCDKAKGERLSIRQQCERNLAACELSDFVRLIQGDAIEAAQQFADGSVFFVFMDDYHENEHIKKEIAAWLPKMGVGATMAGHDYPGVIKDGVLHHFPQVEHIGNSWLQKL